MSALNIEQKFECEDTNQMISLCKSHNYNYKGSFKQKDVYFGSKKGRLKIREIDGREKELIYYERADSIQARESVYYRIPFNSDFSDVVAILTKSNGLLGTVKKTRNVYYNENVRINIDNVEGLGNFIEFEAEIESGHFNKTESKRILEETKKALNISDECVINCSYIDLLTGK